MRHHRDKTGFSFIKAPEDWGPKTINTAKLITHIKLFLIYSKVKYEDWY